MKITSTETNHASSGYVLNGTPVPPHREPPRANEVRHRIRGRFMFLILPFILAGGVALAAFLLVSPTRDVQVAATSGVVTIDGEDIAILIYHDHGRPGLFEPTFQMRVAAIRTSDGTQLWDQRVNEELMDDAVVLAGDAERVYIGSDQGLMILDATTGAVRVQGADVPGLGSDSVLAASAYGYDAESDSVVALAGTGGIMQLRVGQERAVPADGAVASRWKNLLDAGSNYDDTELVQRVDAAVSADGTTYVVEPVSEAVERDALVITSADGRSVIRTELVDIAILPVTSIEPQSGVMMPPAPAGLGQGFLLVQHKETVNSERMLLSSIDAATGRIVATVEMQTDALRVLTGQGGTTAVIAAVPDAWQPNGLLVLQPDGTFHSVAAGVLPWWQGLFH